MPAEKLGYTIASCPLGLVKAGNVCAYAHVGEEEIKQYEYMGCFKDPADNHAMPYRNTLNDSGNRFAVGKCIDYCRDLGYD